MIIIRLKLVLLAPRGKKLGLKILINFMIFIFITREKLFVIQCYTLFFSMAEKQL